MRRSHSHDRYPTHRDTPLHRRIERSPSSNIQELNNHAEGSNHSRHNDDHDNHDNQNDSDSDAEMSDKAQHWEDEYAKEDDEHAAPLPKETPTLDNSQSNNPQQLSGDVTANPWSN